LPDIVKPTDIFLQLSFANAEKNCFCSWRTECKCGLESFLNFTFRNVKFIYVKCWRWTPCGACETSLKLAESEGFWRRCITQNYRVSELCPTYGILVTRKHNFSETGERRETLTLFCPVIEVSSI
jgi:hypothetical protein